jgi:UDP-N-acetylglucosamine--N-acetylmuramyl-(pentapeptide) pyrophosphoryl-undecaprenol N-acetylglucosamine transferase
LKKYIISGGGTGGHIYPAIAIAQALQQQDPEAEVLFVGAEGKMEMQKVPQAGYRIIGLPVAGLQRQLSLQNLGRNLVFPFKLIASLVKAYRVVANFGPNVVIGVGGYASGPVLFVAQLMGIPTLIQEQNSYAGLTNKLLAKRVKRICVAYPGMQHYFPHDKLIFTGNPVRQSLTDLTEAHRNTGYKFYGFDPAKPVLLVIGGSLGARTINRALVEHHAALLNAGVQIIWQTGKSGFATVSDQIKQLYPTGQPSGLVITEFIADMDIAYSTADVVLSRAGALSVSELTLVGKPTILVPSPNVADDHQTKNARALSDRHAAITILDQQLSDQLLAVVLTLLDDTSRRQTLIAAIKELAMPNAATMIAGIVQELAGN